jgi:transcriptional regulator with XRE-family HTH domain
MARTALGWSTTELGKRSGVGANTVNRFERGRDARMSSVDKMRAALEEGDDKKGGVEFIAENGGGPGVRLRKR